MTYKFSMSGMGIIGFLHFLIKSFKLTQVLLTFIFVFFLGNK